MFFLCRSNLALKIIPLFCPFSCDAFKISFRLRENLF
nr:MAG TPA: hypothetical protein [Caudoviricetes sp.]